MARLSGIDLPKNKNVEIGLTYIFGVGLTTSKLVLSKLKIDLSTKVKDLTENQLLKLRDELSNLVLEGDLKRQVSQNIRRLKEVNCYKGNRHKRGLPVHGQRSKTNARTKRGKRIAVAGKKKVTK
jgi:small subunit ribosomal protein S13